MHIGVFLSPFYTSLQFTNRSNVVHHNSVNSGRNTAKSTGGEKTTPEIPDEAIASGGKFLKPASLGFTPKDIGTRVTFTATAAHEENEQGGKTLRSIPVTYKFGTQSGEGKYPLNKTALASLTKVLGKNSDSWVKHSWVSVCINQNNPSTSQQVLAWSIIEDTIK